MLYMLYYNVAMMLYRSIRRCATSRRGWPWATLALARIFASALALALHPAAVRAEAPEVVASFKPVQSLVAAIMEGVGTPALLVKGAASPHSYALSPSD